MTTISNENELKAWNGIGTATLTQNFIVTSIIGLPIDIGKTDALVTLDGNQKIITIQASLTDFPGLVVPISNAQNIVVKNIIIKYDTGSTLRIGAGSINK